MTKSIKLLFLFIFSFTVISAQTELPVIRSNSDLVSIQIGAEIRKDSWRLAPEANPDVFEAEVIGGKTTKVKFITDLDSIEFEVEEGKKYDFIIQKGTEICRTRIVGVRYVPAANFDSEYRSKNRGKISVEIPEVYELVNIAIALTEVGLADKSLVVQDTMYYEAMRKWFDDYKNYKVIRDFNEILSKNPSIYFSLKMNGYAFEFGKNNKIVKSKIYERTGFPGESSNTLEPFIPQLEVFAISSNFRKFFRKNRKTYDDQLKFYRETANISGMKAWLDKNFPASSDYDTYKIVFSPLVGYNQSTTWLESNGFKELQPHVNFPYSFDPSLSAEAQVLSRGAIVFTEINHGYINPEAEKYAERISNAISDRNRWVDPKMGGGYYPGVDTFNEYMNWALVNLLYVDYAPAADQAKLIASIDEMMTKRRGFPKFAEFDGFIIELYKNRKQHETLADLYPQIIGWFERSNK